MTLDLLAIAPHPDDAELSCGGWLAAAAARGQRTGIVDLSAGELATNGTVDIRRNEAAEAARILGLATRETLGMPDGAIAPEPEFVDEVVRVLRALRPAVLLAPWIEARHPDHAAAGVLVGRAHFLSGLAKHRPDLGQPFRPGRLCHYLQRQEVSPDFVVDISAVVGTKRAAIAAHGSQLDPEGATPTLVNAPIGAEVWDVRDRYWGASIGVAHGEPYRLGSPVPIADPVAHFAAHPERPAIVPPRSR